MIERTIHGCAIVLGSTGILLRGKSGSGKSSLCHDLVKDWQRQDKYSSWVADDQVTVRQEKGTLIASCPPSIKGLVEVRFLDLTNIAFQDQMIIDFVIELVEDSELERLPIEQTKKLFIEADETPFLQVPQRNRDHAKTMIQSLLNQKLGNQ